MLSICIPVYNYDIGPLVASLHLQALSLEVAVEIVVMDDASSEHWREVNRHVADLPLVRYIELTENAGRSRIRNKLCIEATYKWLIFMDCDSLPPDQHFLQRYVNATISEAVVCGGRSYLPQPPPDQTHLHWWYGKNREVHPADSRNQLPYRSFMTNNFMIPKTIMRKIPFNELINGYGHEDTLFGYELKNNSIPVVHIDNPLLHTGLQTQDEFLDKTKQGISNLWKIHSFMGKPVEFASMVRVLNTYNHLQRLGLSRAFCTITDPFISIIQKKLSGKKPILYYLDLYKLRLLCLESLRVKN